MKRLATLVAFALIVFALILWINPTNKLPSDNEMIEHFYAHKIELEEIVRRYRSYPEPAAMHYRWAEEPSTAALMKKAGVGDLSNNGWPIFFPDPYSPRSIEMLKKIQESGGYEQSIRHGVIRLSLAGSRHTPNPLKHGTLIKSFYFFPETPAVKDNWIVVPDPSGSPKRFYKLVSSLDFPLDVHAVCQFRLIESKWFICICRSA